MKAGILGGSSRQLSLKQDAQRTVNLWAVQDQNGIDVAALYSRPGLNLLGVTGTGYGRGGLQVANNRVFVVSGSQLFEQKGDGSSVDYGSLDSSTGYVTMADNGFQLAVCDGTSLYIFTYATNVFQKVVNPNLPSASSVIFLDGYFIVSKSPNSGIFQISAPYDGTSWAALDFATAESSPDSLLCVLSVQGQLVLYGVQSTEFWQNTGAANFPFQRTNSAAKMSVGTLAPYTVLELDNTGYWVGQDNQGKGIVYKADGFTPVRISTTPIELLLQAAPDPINLRSFSYQEMGHTFYAITGGGMTTALVLDLATELWSEWAYLDEAGNYELPLQSYVFYAFGKIIALDRLNGNVYEQKMDFYSDNGNPIARERVFTHVFSQSQRFRIANLAIFFESGVANDEVPNPVALLYISADAGRTYGTPFVAPLGEVGQFNERGALFWQCGSYFQCTFKTRVTDAVKVVICGGEFNIGVS